MSESPLTDWLRAAGRGDRSAGDRAYAAIYTELRQLAARQLGGGSSPTLSPTALVNETFLRLSKGRLDGINDRRHFFNLAMRAMRQTLIDHARERLALKRGGDLIHTELSDEAEVFGADALQLLALDQALTGLEQQDAQLAEAFALRFFCGLSAMQIGEMLGVTERTIHRDLAFARNYLHATLNEAS